MKVIRWFLGKLILTWDRLTAPLPMVHSEEEQQRLDDLSSKLKLYQFYACPFCVKVRRQIRRLNLKIEYVDVLQNPEAKEKLVAEGGKYQVPCLCRENEDGTITWIYESDAINEYLQSLLKTN